MLGAVLKMPFYSDFKVYIKFKVQCLWSIIIVDILSVSSFSLQLTRNNISIMTVPNTDCLCILQQILDVLTKSYLKIWSLFLAMSQIFSPYSVNNLASRDFRITAIRLQSKQLFSKTVLIWDIMSQKILWQTAKPTWQCKMKHL